MIVLKEATQDVHVYVDDATGDKYVFDGKKLRKLQFSDGNGDGSSEGGLEIDSDEPSKGKGQSNDKSDPTRNKPQIGDRGDEDELAKEDAEREAKAAAERAERGQEGESAEETANRIKRIKDLLDNKDFGDELVMDQSEKVQSAKKKRAAAQAERERRAQNGGRDPKALEKFKNDLKRFVATQVGAEIRTTTWRKYNSNYGSMGVLKQGHRNEKVGKIPVINVYIDQSGSFGDPDIKMTMDVVNSLTKYEEKGLIKINVYYFADDIYSSPGPARAEGGTSAGGEILDHIRDTKPTNVIVITDNDVDSQGNTRTTPGVSVPGGVWLLFRDRVSQQFVQKIKGKRATMHYMV